MIATVKKQFPTYVFCLAITIGAVAGDMYKWQDRDGVWHFSSTPPATEDEFTILEMPVDPTPLVSMRKLGLNHEPECLGTDRAGTWLRRGRERDL